MASAVSAYNVVQPETDFADFYCGVISKLYDLKCRQMSNKVKSELKVIKRKMCERDKSNQTLFSFKTNEIRCAYMYGYSTLHSVMLYSEFSKCLGRNKKIMLPTLLSESLNIICIGGGPGTETIAVCKSINDFLCKSSANREELLLEIKVTVIHKLRLWKSEEIAVMDAVNVESNVLHSKRLTLQYDFIEADILKPFEEDLKEKIKEASFVIIKFGSLLNKNRSDCQDMQNMLRNILHNMNDNSCLFMLDSSGANVFRSMREVLQEETGTSFLDTSDPKEYRLNRKTGDKFVDLLKYNSSKDKPELPSVKCKVSSCLWYKNALPTNENEKSSNKEVSVKMSSKNSCSSDMHYKGERTRGESSSYSKTQSRVQKKVVSVNKQADVKSKDVTKLNTKRKQKKK